MIKIALLCITAFLFFSSPIYCTNYYLSNTGNDALDGKSPANAWKTIDKYNASKAAIVPGDSVLFKRGNTFVGKILHRSGAAGKPVVYAAYGFGAKPVITGAEQIQNWVSKGNNIYTITGNNLYTHLFVNKKQITIARFPNQLYTFITALNGNTAINSLINIAGVNWTGASFHYRRQNDQIQKGTVIAHSGTSLTLDSNVNMLVNHGFYLDNHLAALDLPYEWFQDKATKLITIKLPAGVLPSSLTIDGSFLDIGLDLSWAGKYVTVHNLEFRNFTNTAVRGSDVNNIRVLNCDFYSNNSSGIWMEGIGTNYSANNEIDGNKFYDHNNIAFGVNKCSNLKVTNNLAKRIALIPGYENPGLNDGMGMFLLSIKNSYVGYNVADSTGYSNIVSSGEYNTFERNTLSNHGLSKNDNGFIQFWGGHTHHNTIRENICFNGFGNIDGLPEVPTPGYYGNGLYFDDYTHDITITGNTVYNSGKGIFVQSSQNMTVKDNLTFNCTSSGFTAVEKDPTEIIPEYSLGWSRKVSGLTLRKNIFYATEAPQNNIGFYSSECGTDYDFGTSDSNYVFNPYSNLTFDKRFPACGKYPPSDVYALKSWQTKYNQELNSKTNKIVYPENSYTFSGSEMLSNGNFDQNVTSWTTYQAGVTPTWDGVNGLNGGTVKLTNTTTGDGELSGPKFNFVAGKKYLLKFTAKTARYEMVTVAFARNSPYTRFNTKGFPVDKEVYNGEWYFTASGGDPITKIQFYISAGNTLWLDNVSLKEVSTATPDNFSERSKLFVNKTTTEQTFSLAGLSYFDLDGNPVCGSIKVAPYRSKVLMRDYNNGCGAQNNCNATGSILREYWTNIPGTSVSAIPVTTAPTSSSQLTIFEGPSDIADNYGSRIRGYICPPTTGLYTFYIASDDNSELWLSTSDQPSDKVKIASVSDWAGVRDWTKFPSQQSVPISLQANTKYYIEALHKEGTSGDNLAVGWQLPDGTQERPIAGSRLSPFQPIILGLNDAKLSESIMVYPNPTLGICSIVFPYHLTENPNLSLYNMVGTKLKTYQILTNENAIEDAINISEFSAGIYYLEINLGTQKVVKKIVKL